MSDVIQICLIIFITGMLIGDYLRPLRLKNKKRMGELGKKIALKLFKKQKNE